MTDFPMPYTPADHPDESDPMPRFAMPRHGYVPLGSGDCGRPLANQCGWGFPPNCGVHGVRSPMPMPTPDPVFITDAGPGVEGPGAGVYRSSVADDPRPASPTPTAPPTAPGIPGAAPPPITYDPRTVRTSHPDGAASWSEVLTWAVHADHIAAPDEAGTLWCAAGPECKFPRWSRYNPSAPGDPDRPVSELFCWLAEHWGCTRGA